MAANLKEAVENFKQFAAPFRAMMDLVDQLVPIADIEQQANEAQAALDAKRSEVEALEKQVVSARAEAAALAESSKADADAVIANAQSEAAQILADAQAKADADAKDVTDAAQAEAESANQKAADAQLAQQEAEAKRDAAQAELTDLALKIGAAKAQMAKMLGA